MALAITFIKFWVLDVHYFPLQYYENTVKNVGCWYSHNNIFVCFFVMILFVTKYFCLFFVMVLLPPLEVSRVPQISAPDPPTHAVSFQLAPKIYFRPFRYFYIFGGSGRSPQKNWNILYDGTWALSLCLDIVPSHLIHSRLSCACCINVDFLKFWLHKIEDSY